MERELNGGEVIVQKFHMLPTPRNGQPFEWVYVAWERADNAMNGKHSTITTFNGQWYGKIGTDPNHELYDHIPVGPDRSAMVRRAYAERFAVAEKCIHDAFPETVGHSVDGYGEIIRFDRFD